MAIKIYIDQGHNPVSPNGGASGNGLREQDITYKVGIELKKLLDANRNFETKLSRPTSTTELGNSVSESLRIRVNEANAFGADYFISIHANASTSPSVSGSEALVFSQPSVASNLAKDILYWLNRLTKLKNRGVITRSGLYVLRRTRMPAVLVELGFITNPTDAKLMNNHPELFAQGIYQGILQYLGLQ